MNNQTLTVLIGNHFEKHGDISIIRFESTVSVLAATYNQFISEGVPSLNQLNVEQKNQYWLEAKRYFSDQAKCIKACKAIYILHLITSQ